jgi:hypothetical protein
VKITYGRAGDRLVHAVVEFERGNYMKMLGSYKLSARDWQ